MNNRNRERGNGVFFSTRWLTVSSKHCATGRQPTPFSLVIDHSAERCRRFALINREEGSNGDN